MNIIQIGKPIMPASFLIILSVIVFITFSFNTTQSIIPLLPILNESPTTNIIDKLVTNVPFIFTLFEIGAMLLGAIFVDLTHSRELILIWPLLLWAVSVIWLATATKKTFTTSMIKWLASLRGFIQPVTLSVGAQVYNINQLNKIYQYFIFSYCAYQLGSFGAQSVVPIDIVEHNVCGNLDCLVRAKIFTSVTAGLALLFYIITSRIFAIPEDVLAIDIDIFKNECKTLITLLGILIPYAIFWKFYQDIIPQLVDLPKLTNLLIISIHDIPRIYTALKILIAPLYYYLVFKWCTKFILKNSAVLMTIGGILIGLWPIITAHMIINNKDQYPEVRDPKPDAIQITYINQCLDSKEATIYVTIDIPFFKQETIYCAKAMKFGYKINRDVSLVLREDNECPRVWVSINNASDTGEAYIRTYCFVRGNRYIWHLSNNRSKFMIWPDRCVRDPYGLPMVCVLLQSNNFEPSTDMILHLNRTNVGEYENLRYVFVNVNQTNPYSCRTVQPGIYAHTAKHNITDEFFEFKTGGVYLIFTYPYSASTFGATNVTIIEPFKSTILDTLLIPSYIIRTIGEFLLITNGFYFVYIQMHSRFRTIGIAIWFILIKYGFIIFEIERYKDAYYKNQDLYILGGILIIMAILFYILQLFLNPKEGDMELDMSADSDIILYRP